MTFEGVILLWYLSVFSQGKEIGFHVQVKNLYSPGAGQNDSGRLSLGQFEALPESS